MSAGNRSVHKFLTAQLNLLVEMCRGDNTKVIETLQGGPDTEGIGVHIDFTLTMAAVEDKKLHPKLRAMFVELLRGMLSKTMYRNLFVEQQE